ncbi:hypothetical protein AMTRI_Chr03g148360 [Amborella trichopoda]
MGDEGKTLKKLVVCPRAKLTVIPAVPGQLSKIHPLSLLDHMMGVHNLRIVFYYKTPRNKEEGLRHESLKEALSETLSSYPIVTGRLKGGNEEGRWEVQCNDAGVRVVEAKVEGTVEDWLERAEAADEEGLTYWEKMPEDPCFWSRFYVQLTQFEGGGFAIGLSCTHLSADPTSATLLIKAWSEIHRRKAISTPPFFHAYALSPNPQILTVHTPATHLLHSKLTAQNTPQNFGENYPSATFHFPPSSVRTLISKIEEETKLQVTPFEALAALFWVASTRSHHTDSYTESICLCTEFRRLLQVPLPQGYFGNALHFSEVSEKRANLARYNSGLALAARLIHEDQDKAKEEEIWSVINWLAARKSDSGRSSSPFPIYGPGLTVANFEGVMSYNAVFTEGDRPLHVSYRVEPVVGEGMVLVLPSDEGDFGRIVVVTLQGDRLSRLRKDKEVSGLGPKVMFKGSLTRGHDG